MFLLDLIICVVLLYYVDGYFIKMTNDIRHLPILLWIKFDYVFSLARFLNEIFYVNLVDIVFNCGIQFEFGHFRRSIWSFQRRLTRFLRTGLRIILGAGLAWRVRLVEVCRFFKGRQLLPTLLDWGHMGLFFLLLQVVLLFRHTLHRIVHWFIVWVAKDVIIWDWLNTLFSSGERVGLCQLDLFQSIDILWYILHRTISINCRSRGDLFIIKEC